MRTEYRIILSLVAGLILGGIFAAIEVDSAGGDAGLLFVPITIFYGLALAVLVVCLEELIFGKPRSKKIAAVVLLIWVTWAVATHFNHNTGSNKSHPHYCNGVPVEQYQGSLPENCRY